MYGVFKPLKLGDDTNFSYVFSTNLSFFHLAGPFVAAVVNVNMAHLEDDHDTSAYVFTYLQHLAKTCPSPEVVLLDSDFHILEMICCVDDPYPDAILIFFCDVRMTRCNGVSQA